MNEQNNETGNTYGGNTEGGVYPDNGSNASYGADGGDRVFENTYAGNNDADGNNPYGNFNGYNATQAPNGSTAFTPQYATDANPYANGGAVLPKKRLNIKLIIIAGVVLVALIAGGIFLGINSSDKAVFAGACRNMIDRVLDEPVPAAVQKTVKNGKLSYTVGDNSILYEEYDSDDYDDEGPVTSAFRNPGTLNWEWYSNQKDGKLVCKASAPSDKDKNVTAYLSYEGAYFQASGLNDSYGVVYKGMFDRIENNDYLYERCYDLYSEENSDLLDALINLTDDYEKATKDVQKYAEKYAKEIFNTVWEKAERSSHKENGDKVIILTIDEEAMADIIESLREKAKKDDDFLKFLDTYLPISSISGGEFEKWKEVFTADEIDELLEELEDSEFEIEVELHASGMSHDMKELTFEMKMDGEKLTATVDMTEKDTIKLTVKTPYDGKLTITYTTSDTGFDLKIDDYTIIFEKEKKNNDFVMTIKRSGNDSKMKIRGQYENTKKHLLLYWDNATVEGEKYDLDITLEFTYGTKLPSFPSNAKDILSLDEDELEELKNGSSYTDDDYYDSWETDAETYYDYYRDTPETAAATEDPYYWGY